MKKCKYADQYKATRPPRCNGGDPCDACKAKWKAAQPRVQSSIGVQEHGVVMRAVGHSNTSEEFGSQEHSCVMDAILGRN